MISFKKNDAILIGVIIVIISLSAIAILLYQNSQEQGHRIAVIAQNGVEIERIDLDTVEEPRIIELPGEYNETVLIENGRIRFEHADCPSQLCIKSGWLTKLGDMAVCLPNKAIVAIQSDDY